MGCRTFVKALRLSPRKKRAEHGVFSPTNMETFAWEEPALRLGAKGKGKKRPTVGRRKNLLWVVSPTYRGSQRRPTVGRQKGSRERRRKPAHGAPSQGVSEWDDLEGKSGRRNARRKGD